MKDLAEEIFLMGLGAMHMTNEKANELKEELLNRGREVYKNSNVLNEELKHNIKEDIKENVTVVNICDMSSKDIASRINNMNEEDKRIILNMLNGDINEK